MGGRDALDAGMDRLRPPLLPFRCCETIHQAPSPDLPIDRDRPGPGLLAHLLVGKYAAHLPLYRLTEIFACGGVELARSLAGWVGQATFALRRLVDAIAAHVLAADKIHGDDSAGAGAVHGQDHDWPAVGLCARRSSLGRRGARRRPSS
jgi:transposase